MTDQNFERRIAFQYLEEIKNRFVKQYGPAVRSALAFEMNKSFQRVLKEQMVAYLSNPNPAAHL